MAASLSGSPVMAAASSLVALVVAAHKLQRPDTIPTDGRKQAIGIGSGGPHFFRNTPAKRVRVRQQVFEHGNDRLSPIRVFPQREGK